MYLILSGCGFHLRGATSAALPAELSSLRVTMGGVGYPPLLVEMRNSLLALGGVRLTDDVSASVPVLQLHAESSATQVLAIDSSGRISAYLINYRVDYSLIGADNKPLLRNQSVKLQREYGFDRLNVIATEKQSEFLQNEMRRDVTQQIVRRLASLNFATARDGGSAANAGAALRPTARDGGSAANAGAALRPTARDGGSAGREAVPPGTSAGSDADQR